MKKLEDLQKEKLKMEDEFLFYKEKDFTLYKGKMQDVLSTFEENSIDSIVCDPPYHLTSIQERFSKENSAEAKYGKDGSFQRLSKGFMGKTWDGGDTAFQPDTWKNCFKVLKEGGYLLAFGGTRTFHRIACAIEDAGFEIRDTIMWLYGSGFPKSMNIGLAIDKKNGVESKVVARVKGSGTTGINDRGNQQFVAKNQYEDGTYDLKQAQKEWRGWGTCLKPAYEPIIVARKPFKGSLVDNVIKNGVGGINIDECRVGEEHFEQQQQHVKTKGIYGDKVLLAKSYDGRFPANVILTYDENDFDEVCGGMPDTKSTTTMPNLSDKNAESGIYSKLNAERIEHLGGFNDSGSASRYFYCAKASKKDRDEGLDLFEYQQTTDGCIRTNSETARKLGANSALRKNIHPTVKPVELMQYLVRLVSPKGSKVLDCFMGSGSTGKACMFENRERNANYHFIGIEMTDEYLPIAKTRIDYAKYKYQYDEIKEKEERKEKGIVNLFDLLEEEGN